jgi:hypothetical protein
MGDRYHRSIFVIAGFRPAPNLSRAGHGSPCPCGGKPPRPGEIGARDQGGARCASYIIEEVVEKQIIRVRRGPFFHNGPLGEKGKRVKGKSLDRCIFSNLFALESFTATVVFKRVNAD